MSKIAYEYLAENVSFMDVYKKDYKRITNWFKKKDESEQEYPWFYLPITRDEYKVFLEDKTFYSKEELFNEIDKACYPAYKPIDDKDIKDIINYRKHLIGIMGNIENLLEPDPEFGSSYTINVYDRLWDGMQDGDFYVIHEKKGRWFVNLYDSEDLEIIKLNDEYGISV